MTLDEAKKNLCAANRVINSLIEALETLNPRKGTWIIPSDGHALIIGKKKQSAVVYLELMKEFTTDET